MGGRCSHPDSRNNKRNSKDNGGSKNTEGDQGPEGESVWVETRRKQAFGEGPWSGGRVPAVPHTSSFCLFTWADAAMKVAGLD